MVLDGVVVAGFGVASGKCGGLGTIAIQKPYFMALGLDLSHCFNGTINLDLAPLRIAAVIGDYYFEQVKWHRQHRPENFSLVSCQLICNDNVYHGYIYYPDPATKPAHFQPDSVLEVLAPLIPNLSYGTKIELVLAADRIIF